jgi:hypothetical protein
MRRTLALFVTALLSGLLALTSLSPAHAGAQFAPSLASGKASPALLHLAGYYSDGGDNDDGYRYRSRGYQQKRSYGDDDGDGDGDGGYYGYRRYKNHDDDGYRGYRHDKKHYDHSGGCGYKRWKRRYVCDEPSPRCFKQRECIWNYGREYCTYVRKCIGGGEQYCRWKSTPYSYCGGGDDD